MPKSTNNFFFEQFLLQAKKITTNPILLADRELKTAEARKLYSKQTGGFFYELGHWN